MPRTKFEADVEKTLEFVVDALVKDDLHYPALTIIGMAAVLIQKQDLLEVERTEDVDILADFIGDIRDLKFTLESLEERELIDGQIITDSAHVVSFFPFGEKPPMSFDFTFPGRNLKDLFDSVRRNAKEKIGEFKETSFYVAKLEDALICKAAVGRTKDKRGLERVIPVLDRKGDVDWDYFWKTARKTHVIRNVEETLKHTNIRELLKGY
ncbi:hypothetical protein AKJ45_03625 [candidate division MSBL1 archaeon SCGC-AAA261F19]|uniref:Nucleotidyl transferase AbiEii/AbiGii toxin family protein n=1 Tax=candidate division MSBL1 archaeon SCGC-AAA261F19 TaxID=1698275 RepID=A0A133V770_9EURY|nr:hypothetical protein AKJ45_03625 [candidate division MSBL1 archaeon SCGC-AAA261F19]